MSYFILNKKSSLIKDTVYSGKAEKLISWYTSYNVGYLIDQNDILHIGVVEDVRKDKLSELGGQPINYVCNTYPQQIKYDNDELRIFSVDFNKLATTTNTKPKMHIMKGLPTETILKTLNFTTPDYYWIGFDQSKVTEIKGKIATYLQPKTHSAGSKLARTKKYVQTPHGKRVVYQGPRGGEYCKIQGKLVSVKKL